MNESAETADNLVWGMRSSTGTRLAECLIEPHPLGLEVRVHIAATPTRVCTVRSRGSARGTQPCEPHARRVASTWLAGTYQPERGRRDSVAM